MVGVSQGLGWASALREVVRFHPLLVCLARRDIRVRYTQSLLGIAWAVLLPLSMMLVFTFVFTRALDTTRLFELQVPYALFAYTGLVPWTYFSSSLSNCLNSLVANRNLVTKVYFPREVLPLSCVASAFVDFGIALTVLGGLSIYFSWIGAYAPKLGLPLLLVPVVILIQTVLTTGLGMALAALNLFYRDVRPVYSVAIQLWMFLSAVVVPLPRDGSMFAVLVAWNPMVPIIHAYRDCLLHARWPDSKGMVYASVFAICVMAFSWIGFRRAAFRFAERI